MSWFPIFPSRGELLVEHLRKVAEAQKPPHPSDSWEPRPQEVADEPGKKFDAGKAPIDLIAPEFIFGTAAVLEFGAKKYGRRNWEKGMSWSRPFGACMRHLWAWLLGEKADPETGMSHLWHASCCIMFLVAFEARSAGNDDRPKIMVDGTSEKSVL